MTDKLWDVCINTASADPDIGCCGGRETRIRVGADSGRAALIKAISEVDINDDELFHTVHIGTPDQRNLMTDESEVISLIQDIRRELREGVGRIVGVPWTPEGTSIVTDKTTELLEAAKAVLPMLKASTNDRDLRDAFAKKSLAEKRAEIADMEADLHGKTPAEKLRKEADDLEAKDAVIQRFRAAVAAFDGETPPI